MPARQMVRSPDLNAHPTGHPSREGSPVGIKKYIAGASQKLSVRADCPICPQRSLREAVTKPLPSKCQEEKQHRTDPHPPGVYHLRHKQGVTPAAETYTKHSNTSDGSKG